MHFLLTNWLFLDRIKLILFCVGFECGCCEDIAVFIDQMAGFGLGLSFWVSWDTKLFCV